MKTPDGQECRFYYENFHRGRSDQECRLVIANAQSLAWQPTDCAKCPVPAILQANSDPNLVLEVKISKGMLGFGRKLKLKAFCSKHLVDVPEPRVGCPQCAKEKPGLGDLFEGL
jgi:hypothetical protein